MPQAQSEEGLPSQRRRDQGRESQTTLQKSEAALDAAKGQVNLDLETDLKAGVPCLYVLEGEVTDVSRQSIRRGAPRSRSIRRPGTSASSRLSSRR